jgi:predicted DsbA family dithiol-disulfide isomerase
MTSTRSLVVWGDIACPWATLALVRLHAARARLGLVDAVAFDLRAFPLELVNSRPTPRTIVDAEIPVVGALAPAFGWSPWRAPVEQYAVSTLLALEAVQAAKEQGVAASEQLDLALRRAFFAESGCITLRPVVLDVAASCPGVDATALADALDAGRARPALIEQWRAGVAAASPTVVLPDGSRHVNPGVRMHWAGEHGRGFPIVDAGSPSSSASSSPPASG